jgi:hypothetical protein
MLNKEEIVIAVIHLFLNASRTTQKNSPTAFEPLEIHPPYASYTSFQACKLLPCESGLYPILAHSYAAGLLLDLGLAPDATRLA